MPGTDTRQKPLASVLHIADAHPSAAPATLRLINQQPNRRLESPSAELASSSRTHPSPTHHPASSQAPSTVPATKTAETSAVIPRPTSTTTKSISLHSESIELSSRCCPAHALSPTVGDILRLSRSRRAETRPRLASNRTPIGPSTIASAAVHFPLTTSDTQCSHLPPNTRQIRKIIPTFRCVNNQYPLAPVRNHRRQIQATVVAPTPARPPATTTIGNRTGSAHGSTRRRLRQPIAIFPLDPTLILVRCW